MSPIDHTRFEELKEAYVLNALSEDERQDFEAYLAAHPEHQAEIDELASAANLLALACEEREPSPELRHSLLAQIESEAWPLPPTTRTNWWTRLWEALDWRRLAVGLAALVFAALLGWNIVLQSELHNRQIY
ncbi:MAG: hypothetical protein JOZ19_16555, partial [Rubrobacter sp.]|nr:hypothetical protein [Rubrobacter sp.]